MGPMLLATVIVAVSGAANLALDVGLNTLQNWSDVLYRDAFWSRDIASPELAQLAREEAEIARLLAGADFAVGTTEREDFRSTFR